MSTEAAMVRLEQVSKSYVLAPEAAPVTVLREVTWSVGAGESVAVMGPSGSGKSTLLQLLGTLDRPDSGQIWLGGQELSRLDERQLAAVRNRQIGFIFQQHHLLPQCTVWENVLVPTLACADAAERATAPERARRLLQRVGLAERLDHVPGQLSGGERQRVAVVRALINRPQLLLADEPTGSLDRATADELAQLLMELNREEAVTLVLVTHAPELARRTGRVYELREGRLAG